MLNECKNKSDVELLRCPGLASTFLFQGKAGGGGVAHMLNQCEKKADVELPRCPGPASVFLFQGRARGVLKLLLFVNSDSLQRLESRAPSSAKTIGGNLWNDNSFMCVH